MAYSSGKHAKGICDRCGGKVPYQKLLEEWTGLKVCKSCLDFKTKQEFPTNFPVDPETLYEPRPDYDIESGSGIIRPEGEVGAAFGSFSLTIELGSVTVNVT